jgi:hypothetical protein
MGHTVYAPFLLLRLLLHPVWEEKGYRALSFLTEFDPTLLKYDTSQYLLLGMAVINSWHMFRSCTNAISVVIGSIHRGLLHLLGDAYKRQLPWRFMSYMSKDRRAFLHRNFYQRLQYRSDLMTKMSVTAGAENGWNNRFI